MRVRIGIRVVVAALLLAGLGLFLARDAFWPPSDEEQILELFEDLVCAWCDEDFEEVWELTARGLRSWVASVLTHLKRDGGPLSWGLEHSIDREDYLRMDPGEFYVAWQRMKIREHPDAWPRTVAGLRALRIRDLRIEGDGATIYCPPVADEPVEFWFRREEGEWRFGGAREGRLQFKVLERKLALFLPKTKVNQRNTCLLIEIGTNGVDEESLALLGAALDRLPRRQLLEGGAVVDAWPEIPFHQVVAVASTLRAHGAVELAFAADGSVTRPRGLRINGVDVSQIEPGFRVPKLWDHSAFTRIIGLHQD